LIRDRKETTYHGINIYNKISDKDEAMRNINQDKQLENDWKTVMEHSTSISPLADIH
jgi:hypothetical protein